MSSRTWCGECDGIGRCRLCGGGGKNTHLNSNDTDCEKCAGNGRCPDCRGSGTNTSEWRYLVPLWISDLFDRIRGKA